MFKRRERAKSMKSIIRSQLPCSRRGIYISDKHLDPISDKDMGAFMVYDNAEKRKYRSEIWDCDDFSLQFMALAKRYFAPKGINAAIGIIWTENHAFNLSVNTNFKVRLWEPQTDRRCVLDSRIKLIMM